MLNPSAWKRIPTRRSDTAKGHVASVALVVETCARKSSAARQPRLLRAMRLQLV